ncbi:arsenate reductase (azurin) small subunit [Sphingomonas pokkalii]|uniref:Arsenate reductase (Azurin) small subunit n=2 Tax=Sphingomonas pokkalii TaxID=2175090 RepID=A0A2U0SAV2_9SPHN|nr:arsenate reductase (azurin) small subunit [Sphingomonas pokkalii]
MDERHRTADLSRRQLLGVGAIGALAPAAGCSRGGLSRRESEEAASFYPSRMIGRVADLKVDVPVAFVYPDPGSPAVLLRLGHPVLRGAGPGRDIVAFSTLCPHKGYPLGFCAADRSLVCPGHFSRFDCELGGQQIWGHATQNLAQIKLAVDDEGAISAVSIDELIYGRLHNVLRG